MSSGVTPRKRVNGAVAAKEGKEANDLGTLADMYGRVGLWTEAVETLERAIAVAESAGDSASVAKCRQKAAVMVIKEAES